MDVLNHWINYKAIWLKWDKETMSYIESKKAFIKLMS